MVASVVVLVGVIAIAGLPEEGGVTSATTTRCASTARLGGTGSATGAGPGSDVRASDPDVGLDAAGCRHVASVGRFSESVVDLVGAATSAPELFCSAGVPAVDVADLRSSGAAVVAIPDVSALRARRVLDTFSVLPERNSGADGSDRDGDWRIGGRNDDRADPDLEADGPNPAAVAEPVVPCGDEGFPAEEPDEGSDEESDDEEGPEFVGDAEATPEDPARPTPIPKATTSAPTPLINLASPIIASPIHDDEQKATPSVFAAKGKENYRLKSRSAACASP